MNDLNFGLGLDTTSKDFSPPPTLLLSLWRTILHLILGQLLFTALGLTTDAGLLASDSLSFSLSVLGSVSFNLAVSNQRRNGRSPFIVKGTTDPRVYC